MIEHKKTSINVCILSIHNTHIYFVACWVLWSTIVDRKKLHNSCYWIKNCLCVFLNVQIIFFQIVEFFFRSQLVLCRLVTLVILINAFSALFFLPFFSLHITKLMFIHITSDFLSIHLMISCFPFILGVVYKWWLVKMPPTLSLAYYANWTIILE